MDGCYRGDDRRKFRRIRVNLNVIYHRSGAFEVSVRNLDRENLAVMLDISEGGIAIITDLQIPVNTVIMVKFLFNSNGKVVSLDFYGRIEVLGQVRYSSFVKKDVYRIGIAFIKLDETNRNKIHKFITICENPTVSLKDVFLGADNPL